MVFLLFLSTLLLVTEGINNQNWIPQQLHIQLSGNSLQDSWAKRTIMWVTFPNDIGQIPQGTYRLYFSTNKDNITHSVPAVTSTYSSGGWDGTIYKSQLENLKPNTRYYYKAGNLKENVFSNLGFFDTWKSTKPTPQDPLTFAVFGDQGTLPWAREVAQSIYSDIDSYDGVLLVGDIAYASTKSPAPPDQINPNDPYGGEWEWIWDLWFSPSVMGDINAQIPTICTVGNHEKFYNYTSYLHRFENPPPWGGMPLDNPKFWFSFQVQNVHYTSFSSEHPYDVGTPQYLWMEADLKAASANPSVDWIIVADHRPIYCSDVDEWNSHRPGSHIQTTIEPLLNKYGVDLHLSGHMHIYERVNPVINGVTAELPLENTYYKPSAPVYIVQGTGGMPEDMSWINPTPEWSEKRISRFGYGKLEIHNATFLHYQFYATDDAVEPTGVVDDWWISKS